jgi:hypothetical protein
MHIIMLHRFPNLQQPAQVLERILSRTSPKTFWILKQDRQG